MIHRYDRGRLLQLSSPMADTVEEYMAAAAAHAEARVRYAQEFQLAFHKSANSFHATQVAIERTKDETTLTAARLKVAETRMVNE